MSRNDPLSQVSTRVTPQAKQADPRQVPNSAGGWGFTVNKSTRLHRFLTLGTDGGTYYASERNLTTHNAQVVIDYAKNAPLKLVEQAVDVSVAGRAPRNNPALFALAAAAGLGDDAGRRAALAALPRVARTGTHLFTFAGYAEQFRGWGRGLRKGVGSWYLRDGSSSREHLDSQDSEDADRVALDRLAYQILKYRQREGWTHRDMLRLAHPKTASPARNALFKYIAGHDVPLTDLPPLVSAFEHAQRLGTEMPDMPTGTARRSLDQKKATGWEALIRTNPSLSWEMLPDEALSLSSVWEALIENGIPQTALMRQLPRLTKLGVLAQTSFTTSVVADQLADPERLRKARVHPVNVLVALRTYASGHSARGSMTWTPVPKIIDALDAAFYAAYGAVEPAGKRTMVALDVSGSMDFLISGLPLSCREASAALALVIASTEPQVLITGFTSARLCSGISPLAISPRQRLNDVVRYTGSLPFGGTDCALPMLWALENDVAVDTFLVVTDNETWAGRIHPHQALEQYRQKTGIPARLAVAAMTATDFTIADPADEGSLDVSGFDSSVPGLLADFSRGDI